MAQNIVPFRPEEAGFRIAKLGFGLERWEYIRTEYRLPPINDEDLDKGRTYGITLTTDGHVYVIGKLFCDAIVEVADERDYLKGYFYNLDADSIADNLHLWDIDTDKKDEARFPVVRGPEGATYHVNPLFDKQVTLEKLVKLCYALEGCGFVPAHPHLDDPRYIAFLNGTLKET